MKIVLITTLCSILFLTGCASQKVQTKTEYVDYNKDLVIEELRKSSKAVSEALMIMARNDNALKSEVLNSEQIRQQNALATVQPPGMERTINFKWDGYAVNALEALAEVSDYKFVLGGVKPVPMLEPMAYIDHEKSIIDIIRLIESQTKNELEINIHVFDDKRHLEVNYVR